MTPPPPDARTRFPDAFTDTPAEQAKKAWRRPTLSTMNGVITTDSGPTPSPAGLENAKYFPSS